MDANTITFTRAEDTAWLGEQQTFPDECFLAAGPDAWLLERQTFPADCELPAEWVVTVF